MKCRAAKMADRQAPLAASFHRSTYHPFPVRLRSPRQNPVAKAPPPRESTVNHLAVLGCCLGRVGLVPVQAMVSHPIDTGI